MSFYVCGMSGLLTVGLLGLKAAGLIGWPWLWVFAPILAPAVLAMAVMAWLGRW